MGSVLVNVAGKLATGRVRSEKLWGRDYLVAPVTMIVPGVLNGSAGPLYYPPEQVQNNPQVWNGMPLVLYHPKRAGVHISARDPEVLNSQGMGFVLRASAPHKLCAEAWFDRAQTASVDERVVTALENGEPIEISTGLFAHNVPAPAGYTDHNGNPYSGLIATNYQPDHLAILPDQRGACSVEDGCGVLAANSRHFVVTEDAEEHLDRTTLSYATLTPSGIRWEPVTNDVLGSTAPLQQGEFVNNPQGQWQPPNAGKDAPAEVKRILATVYKKFRDAHPAENPATKAKGAKIAWGAVKKAGWSKDADGKWKKQPTSNVEGSTDWQDMETLDVTTIWEPAENASKTEGGTSLPKSAYAYTPSDEPSTWKLRIDDARHVAGAVAAIGKGFRGQKVKIPPAAMGGVRAKIKAAWKKFNKDKDTSEMPKVLNTDDLTTNAEMSLDEVESAVRCAFREAHPTKYDPDTGRPTVYRYVVAIFSDYVVYAEETGTGDYFSSGDTVLYREDFTWEGVEPAFSGEPEAVQRVTTYESVTNCAGDAACACNDLEWEEAE